MKGNFRQIVLDKFKSRFQGNDDIQEGLFEGLEQRGEFAVKLSGSLLDSGLGLCVDKIADCFGLT